MSLFSAAVKKNDGGKEVLLKAVRGGRIVGYAKWMMPEYPGEEKVEGEGKGKEGEDGKGEKPLPFAEGTNVPLALDFFGKCTARHKSLPQPHIRAFPLPSLPQQAPH